MKGHPSGPGPDSPPPQGPAAAPGGGPAFPVAKDSAAGGGGYDWVRNAHRAGDSAGNASQGPSASGPARRLAVAAAVLFMFGPVSVVCGHLALSRSPKGDMDTMEARNGAFFGLVMGYIFTAGYVWAAYITVA